MVGQYLLIRSSICALFGAFTSGMTPFLLAESRYFVIVCSSLCELTTFTLVFIFCLVQKDIKFSLSMNGVAYAISSGISCVWLIIVLLKLNILDVTYKGVIRFSFKRLSPIRPKFILAILKYCGPSIVQSCAS